MESAFLQISIVKWNGDAKSGLGWVLKYVMTSTDVMHVESGAFEGMDQSSRPNIWKTSPHGKNLT